MTFNWQAWTEIFITAPGHNDTQAVISEAIRPSWIVLGVHRLVPNDDDAKQCIYIDALDKNNKRAMDAELEYNNGVSKPSPIKISQEIDSITSISFTNDNAINIWHPDGEAVIGIKPGFSYLVVFKEADPKPLNLALNLGGIQVTVKQSWIANLKPNLEGNVTFFVDIVDIK